MIVILVIVFEVLGVLSAVHAVMSVRTPQGSIAWAVSLVTFPYVSVPAYWVFGRNKFQGYVLARRNDINSLSEVIRQANVQLDTASVDESVDRGAAFAYAIAMCGMYLVSARMAHRELAKLRSSSAA